MSSVDDRIVNMQFNNKQFQTGAAESQRSLEGLDKTIAGMAGGKGLSTLESSVGNVTSRFGALKIAGITAIATIAQKATMAGLNLVKSLTIDPITAGFREYETNLNSIQTIMANTGKSVNVVNTYLNDLNHYSDQTIYNFSQMADSIGKFTAAGVPIKDATSAIKGMANTAALSGANVQQLNTAMYQMSQALSTGTIRLMDWNSLANAGMGGSNVREALMATNRTLGDHGKAMDAAIEKNGSFRDSLQEGWLSAETFNKTMKVMAGQTDKTGKTVAYTVDQLKKMGYDTKAAKELNKLSQASIDSATKIKTLSQLIDVVKESIGSGFAKIFQDLFGNFNEASKLWTTVGTNITNFVSTIFTSVDKVLTGWRDLGGFQDLWEGFGNIFQTIGNLLGPFVTAFKTLLPETGKAGAGLAKATSAFAAITGWMEKASRGAAVLTPILVAIFGVFKDIGVIGGAVIRGLQPLLDILGDFGSLVGDMAQQGSGIAGGIIAGILGGLDASSIQRAVTEMANNIVDWIKNTLGIHSPAAELVPVGLAVAQGIAEGLINGVKFVFDAMGTVIETIFGAFDQLFGGMDALDWASLFNMLLTGGLLLALKKVADGVGSFQKLLGSVTGVFDEVTGTLKTMQASIKAGIIMKIAIAVGILTLSLVALSLLKPEKIAIGLGALSGMVGLLVGSLAVLSKIDEQGLVKMSFAMLTMSAAMLILSAAVAAMGSLPLQTLEKGLGGIAIAMGIMVTSLTVLAKLGPTVGTGAGAILIMSGAMTALAGAVALFGNMDMKTLAKGLGAVAIAMGIMVTSLTVLSKLGPTVGLGAGGILIMSGAMVVLAGAVLAFGKMKMSTLAKGLGAIAISMGIFVIALSAMAAMGPLVGVGAGGILMMAAAMAILVPVILTLGTAPWQTVAVGIGFVALALAVFLAAGAAAMVIGPGLITLGVAIGLLGVAMALAGVGMLAFGTGFAIMAAAGTAGVAVLIAGFQAFMALLPTFALQIAAALVTFVETIAKASPRLRDAFGEIIKNILGTISDAIPELAKLITKLIDTGIDIVVHAVPAMASAALDIVQAILDTFNDHLPDMIDVAGDIIANFITGIGDNSQKVVSAASQTIIKFIKSLTATINEDHVELVDSVIDLAGSIIHGLADGLVEKAKELIPAALDKVLELIPGPIKDFFGIFSPSRLAHYWGEMIVTGLANGITDSVKLAVGASIVLANAVIAAGDKMIARSQRQATKAQIAAAKAQAKADVTAKMAADKAREARQHPNDKKLQKEAAALQALADKQQTTADKFRAQADAAAQKVIDAETWAAADNQERGDIKSDRAKELSDRAIAMLAKANAEAQAAKKLQGKARQEMLEQAKKDAKAAKELADQSKAAQKAADEYYAKSVKERIKQLEDERKAEKENAEEQARFDAATNEEKSKIMEQRAEADQKKADKAEALSLKYLEQAKKLAKTDPVKAQKLLDMAEEQADIAKEYAEQAKQESDQAKQLAGQSDNPSGVIRPSSSVLEDAASAIDRYTESLQQAEEAAAAAPSTVQYTQNNYSPESLAPGDIYRGTKNLLSAQEIKMAAPD